MTWFVASLRDEDTHLGGEITDGTVTAWCSRSFRPLATLKGSPLDPLQICPTCAQSQRDNSARSGHHSASSSGGGFSRSRRRGCR